MKEAGLTVGGFYKHFKSRDALVAEAVGSALELWQRQVDSAATGGPPVTYESLVDGYLNETHRDHPGVGCAVGALAPDLARTSKRTRAVVTQKIRNNIELLATLIRGTNGKGSGAARSRGNHCVLRACRRHRHGPRRIGRGTFARNLEDCGKESDVRQNCSSLATPNTA